MYMKVIFAVILSRALVIKRNRKAFKIGKFSEHYK